MADYIISILRSNPFVVMSWGFHNAIAIENGIAFMVQGYLFTGRVEVVYDEGQDLFTVRLRNADGTVKKEQDGIYSDGVLSTIDELVEKAPNYEERVRRDYGFLSR